MSLEYSDRASIALAEFYKKFNKKTVFIEDTNGRLMYERLLRKLLGDGVITRIFALHGRDAVIADWEKNKGNSEYIYIIDGDMDVILGNNKSDRNLLQLDCYCVENVVMSPEAIADVAIDYLPAGADMDMVVDHVVLLLEEIAKHFVPLYVLYAVGRREGVGLPDVSEGALRYFGQHDGFDTEGIYSRLRDFAHQLKAAIGPDSVRDRRREITLRVRQCDDAMRLLSGKAVLLPILHKYAEWNLRYVGRKDVFLAQASRYASIPRDSKLGKALLALFAA